VHVPTEDKSGDTKDSFYKELECVFNQFPKYCMKILLHFNTKVGRDDNFKPTVRHESLYGISTDNGVRVVNLARSGS